MVGAPTTPSGPLEFRYDADGIRWQKSVAGVVTNFAVDKNRDFAQVLEERDAAGAIDVLYVYGDDLISQERATTGLAFYHMDGQMSTRQLTDAGASVTDTYTFDAFGVALAQTGITANNWLYGSQQLDVHLQHYYLRARYLNHHVGRFASQDPTLGSANDPLTLHRYLYANVNPISNSDPSGMSTLTEILTRVAIGLILVALFNAVIAVSRMIRSLPTAFILILFSLEAAKSLGPEFGAHPEFSIGIGFQVQIIYVFSFKTRTSAYFLNVAGMGTAGGAGGAGGIQLSLLPQVITLGWGLAWGVEDATDYGGWYTSFSFPRPGPGVRGYGREISISKGPPWGTVDSITTQTYIGPSNISISGAFGFSFLLGSSAFGAESPQHAALGSAAATAFSTLEADSLQEIIQALGGFENSYPELGGS